LWEEEQQMTHIPPHASTFVPLASYALLQPSTAHVSHKDGTVREHVVRRPSPAAPSASEAAVAAAAAAATRGARAIRCAAGVLASEGAAAYTVFSGAMNIFVGVGVSSIDRLCGLRRRRGGRRR